jgi:hypothetical protein
MSIGRFSIKNIWIVSMQLFPQAAGWMVRPYLLQKVCHTTVMKLMQRTHPSQFVIQTKVSPAQMIL